MPTTTSATAHIDRIYDRFVARLPQGLAAKARDLPRTLGLTPHQDVPWSVVFNNPAVLGLPLMLLGKADRAVSAQAVEAAATAHLLGIIGAFCVDRIDDGQISADACTLALLAEVHRVRDETLAYLRRDNEHPMTFAWATQQTHQSVVHEREVFEGERAPSWMLYRDVSLEKQGLAFPASVVSARAAGWTAEDEQRVYDVVAGAALGLQYRDDVVDWIEDHERGASWAVALGARGRDEDAVTATEALHGAQILVRMLEMSRDEFMRASLAATALGATDVARWAAGQAQLTDRLAQDERRDPGAAVRWELQRRSTKAALQEARMTQAA
jgi:hypothetical protein